MRVRVSARALARAASSSHKTTRISAPYAPHAPSARFFALACMLSLISRILSFAFPTCSCWTYGAPRRGCLLYACVYARRVCMRHSRQVRTRRKGIQRQRVEKQQIETPCTETYHHPPCTEDIIIHHVQKRSSDTMCTEITSSVLRKRQPWLCRLQRNLQQSFS